MWIEWSLGRYGGVRGSGSTPGILDAIWKSRIAKYVGAIGIFMPFIVMVYYTYVESWSLGFSLLSIVGAFPETGGIEEMTHFLRAYQGAEMHTSAMFGNMDTGAFIFPGLAYGFFLFTLGANLWFLYKGLSGGIEKVALYGLPALFIFAVILMVRVLTLGTPDPAIPENSISNGLGFIWNPDLSALSNPQVWLAAAGQIFFTLSLGMGSIHVYASYLSEKDDVALSGLSTSATNETAEVVMGGTIAIPAAVVVTVCPRPQKAPTSAPAPNRRVRATMVATATTWSGSVACWMPKSRPRSIADQRGSGAVTRRASAGARCDARGSPRPRAPSGRAPRRAGRGRSRWRTGAPPVA